jgi:hypothetical protein
LKFKGLERGTSDLGNEYLTLKDVAQIFYDVEWLLTRRVSKKWA